MGLHLHEAALVRRTGLSSDERAELSDSLEGVDGVEARTLRVERYLADRRTKLQALADASAPSTKAARTKVVKKTKTTHEEFEHDDDDSCDCDDPDRDPDCDDSCDDEEDEEEAARAPRRRPLAAAPKDPKAALQAVLEAEKLAKQAEMASRIAKSMGMGKRFSAPAALAAANRTQRMPSTEARVVGGRLEFSVMPQASSDGPRARTYQVIGGRMIEVDAGEGPGRR